MLLLPGAPALSSSLHAPHALPYSWSTLASTGCAGGRLGPSALNLSTGRGQASENVSSIACPAAAGGRLVESEAYGDLSIGAIVSYRLAHPARTVNVTWNLSGSARVGGTGHLGTSSCPWQNTSLIYHVSNPTTGAATLEYINDSQQACEFQGTWEIALTPQVYDATTGTTAEAGAFFYNASGAYYDRYIVNYTYLGAGFKNSSSGWVVQQHAYGSPYVTLLGHATTVTVRGTWSAGDHLVVTAVASLIAETIVEGVARGSAQADIHLGPPHGHANLVGIVVR